MLYPQKELIMMRKNNFFIGFIIFISLSLLVPASLFAKVESAASKVLISTEKTEDQKPPIVSGEATATAPVKNSGPKSGTAATKKKGYELPNPDPEWEKSSPVEKETQGIVTGVSAQGIAVEYAVSKKEGGQEIWFNYTTGIKLVGINGLSELGEGDKVKVAYSEAPDNRRLISEITLVRKKPKERAESQGQKETE